jgi:hypothetical protein
MQNLPSERLVPLGGHNRFQEVDRLYDPLRHSFDPSQQHTVNGTSAINSHVSRQTMHLTPQQMVTLLSYKPIQKETTLIPAEDRLVPTHNMSLLAGTGNLVAIDSHEKVGVPMSSEQIHERMRQRQPD